MDKMKMLNDEELENVVGGVERTYYRLSEGKVSVTPEYFCCQNLSFFKGIPGDRQCCMYCQHCDGRYCTNPDFIAQLTNG